MSEHVNANPKQPWITPEQYIGCTSSAGVLIVAVFAEEGTKKLHVVYDIDDVKAAREGIVTLLAEIDSRIARKLN